MKTIHLTGSDLVEDIAILSHELDGSLQMNSGCSYTSFQNEKGEGNITAIKVSEEISTLIFDVKFYENVKLSYSHNAKECIDLFFCLEGFVLHKLDSEKNFEKINFRQNALVKRLKSSNGCISFEPNVTLKMSFISYTLPDNKKATVKTYRDLRELASKALFEISENKEYRYLGRICFRTSDYMSKMMSFSFETASDIIFKEAAILNTLASQLDRYDSDEKNEYSNAPIKQYEIDKILAIENFIADNLVENLDLASLERLSGLSPAKLQAGFNYLYNNSVRSYITEKRLDKAAELLQETELTVSEIVYQVGFTSRSYFSKIFKRRYGFSPSIALKNEINISSSQKAQ